VAGATLENDDPWAVEESQDRRQAQTAVSLTPASLSLVSRSSGDPKTKYAIQGMDAANIKERLIQTRCCRCKTNKSGNPCSKNVSLDLLVKTCTNYWTLTDEDKAHLIRCLHAEAHGDAAAPESGLASAANRKVHWSLFGVPVCFSVFCRLLGTSEPTLRKYIHGGIDMRKTTEDFAAAPRIRKQSMLCDWWFLELYQSAAEPLPTEAEDMDNTSSTHGDLGDPWLAPDITPVAPAECCAPDKPTVESITKLTLASSALVVGLPRRFLPHARVHDLYWLFLASWDTVCPYLESKSLGVQESAASPAMIAAPSWTTLWRCWNQTWSRYLSFRKSSQHAQCQTCFELQQELHARKNTWARRAQAAKSLREHCRQQYLDRCIYWSLRMSSQQGSDVLCIIIDSMDQKNAWPRWPFDRVPKRLETLDRPKLVVTAAMAHGYCSTLYFADETVSHGSDAFCEVLSQP